MVDHPFQPRAHEAWLPLLDLLLTTLQAASLDTLLSMRQDVPVIVAMLFYLDFLLAKHAQSRHLPAHVSFLRQAHADVALLIHLLQPGDRTPDPRARSLQMVAAVRCRERPDCGWRQCQYAFCDYAVELPSDLLAACHHVSPSAVAPHPLLSGTRG